MAGDRRDGEQGRRVFRRVGTCASAPGHAHSIQRAHASFVRRCARAGIRIVEDGALVPFSPWRCATCQRKDDLLIAGSIAFCRACLDAAPREDADDLYQDTGGGD
jgi:hypothetical protein